MLLYAAIIGLLALLGGIFWYGNQDTPELEQVEIELTSVELISVNTVEGTTKLSTTFLVKNPSDTTFTVSLIDYQLYADGELLGSGQYSTVDVAMPGRAIFSSGAEIPLKNTIELKKSEINDEIYQKVLENDVESYRAEGTINTESAWSSSEKKFDSST